MKGVFRTKGAAKEEDRKVDEVETQDESTDESLQVAEESPEQQLSPEEELIERLKAAAEENYDKYIRAVAELENYKKRALKERSELIRYAGENLARDLLEVVDTLRLALANEGGTPEDFRTGIQLVFNKFVSIFEQHSIRDEEALGQLFDPNKHQALASTPTDETTPGTILQEYKRAYFYRDKLLRPGQVVVAVEPPKAEPQKDDSAESEASEVGDEPGDR